MDREQPYDPYIPSGHAAPNGSTQHGGDGRTAALQAKINETVGIMKQNLNSTGKRGEEIVKLQDQAGDLERNSDNFRARAKKVKRQMCLSNLKWWFILGGVLALIIIVIAVSVTQTKHH